MNNIRIILQDGEYIGERQILQKSQFITSIFDICDDTHIIDFTIYDSDDTTDTNNTNNTNDTNDTNNTNNKFNKINKNTFDVYYNTLANVSYLDNISPNDYNIYIKIFDFLCFSEGLEYIDGLIKKIISNIRKYDDLKDSFYQSFDNNCKLLIHFFETVDEEYISNIPNKTLLNKVIKSLYYNDDNIFSLRNDIDEIRFHMSDIELFDVVNWSIPPSQTNQKTLCDITEFTHNFNAITHDYFNVDFDWSNIVVSGGSIYTILTKKTMKKYSDIDMWLYGDIETQRKKVFYLLDRFRRLFSTTIYVGINMSVIYIFINDLNIYFNIVCSVNYTNPYDIINNFDLSHVMMFYDGVDVNFTNCSLASIMYGVVKKLKKIKLHRIKKLYDLGLSLLTCDDDIVDVSDVSELHICKKKSYVKNGFYKIKCTIDVQELNLAINKSSKLMEPYYPQSIYSDFYNKGILAKTNNINNMYIINDNDVIQNIVSSVCYIKKIGDVVSDYSTKQMKPIKNIVHNCSIKFYIENWEKMHCIVNKMQKKYVMANTTNASLMNLLTQAGNEFTMHNVSIKYIEYRDIIVITRIYGENFDYKIYRLSDNKASLYYNSGYGKTDICEQQHGIVKLHKIHDIQFMLLNNSIIINKNIIHQSSDFNDKLIVKNVHMKKPSECDFYCYDCRNHYIFDNNGYQKVNYLVGYFNGDVVFEMNHRTVFKVYCIIDRDNVPLNKYNPLLNKFDNIRTEISVQHVDIYTYEFYSTIYRTICYNKNEPLILSLSNVNIFIHNNMEHKNRLSYVIANIMSDHLVDLVKQIMLKFSVECNVENINLACNVDTNDEVVIDDIDYETDILDHKIDKSVNTNEIISEDINKSEIIITKPKSEYVGAVVDCNTKIYDSQHKTIKFDTLQNYEKTANLVVHIKKIYKTRENKYIPSIKCLKCEFIE